MKLVLFLSISIFILTSCNTKSTYVFKTSNLESSFITINPDSAYRLKTAKGSIIKIAAGTFKTREKVDIEIKEAFSMQDILLAGLSTQSNGRPLQSGGMVYFKASAKGKELDFNKPVEISIPSDTYDANMKLFKGEVLEDSSIN